MFISNFIKRQITIIIRNIAYWRITALYKKIISLGLAPENEGVYNFTIKNPNFS